MTRSTSSGLPVTNSHPFISAWLLRASLSNSAAWSWVGSLVIESSTTFEPSSGPRLSATWPNLFTRLEQTPGHPTWMKSSSTTFPLSELNRTGLPWSSTTWTSGSDAALGDAGLLHAASDHTQLSRNITIAQDRNLDPDARRLVRGNGVNVPRDLVSTSSRNGSS